MTTEQIALLNAKLIKMQINIIELEENCHHLLSQNIAMAKVLIDQGLATPDDLQMLQAQSLAEIDQRLAFERDGGHHQ